MSENLKALESELTALLKKVSPVERKKLARIISRDLRQSQLKRIKSQKNPDGSPYTKRKANFITVQREMRFIWRGQKRTLQKWRSRHDKIIGIDTEKKAERSFKRGDIQRFLSVKKDRIKVKGNNKQTRMFKRLATARYMRTRANENEATILFTPSAARIAEIHQFGLKERLGNIEVQYPSRELLGFTPEEITHIESLIVNTLAR